MLILIAGFRCAGKGTLIEYVSKKFPVVVMGDVVREYMKENGINEDIREFSDKMRKKYGRDIFAKMTWEKIKNKEGIIFVDGLRSIYEVNFFKKKIPAILLFIDADKKIRFERMLKRNRKGDPKTYEEFLKADNIENSWGLGQLKKFADFVIENNNTKKEFYNKIDEFLNNLVDKD